MSDATFIDEDDDPAPLLANKDCRHPGIVVQLTGCDGGTGAIMSRVIDALEDDGVDRREINEFRTNVLFVGNYNEVLQYVMSWVTVK